MIHITYLELVADGLGLSSAGHEVLPSATVSSDGSLIHSKMPSQLSLNTPKTDRFSAIRTPEFYSLSPHQMRRLHSKPIVRRATRRFSPIHF
jgi:hypothetical protein